METEYFNRFEFKYIISSLYMEKILSKFKEHCEYDKNSSNDEGYYVNSLYFDTYDLKFYFEKIKNCRKPV